MGHHHHLPSYREPVTDTLARCQTVRIVLPALECDGLSPVALTLQILLVGLLGGWAAGGFGWSSAIYCSGNVTTIYIQCEKMWTVMLCRQIYVSFGTGKMIESLSSDDGLSGAGISIPH